MIFKIYFWLYFEHFYGSQTRSPRQAAATEVCAWRPSGSNISSSTNPTRALETKKGIKEEARN